MNGGCVVAKSWSVCMFVCACECVSEWWKCCYGVYNYGVYACVCASECVHGCVYACVCACECVSEWWLCCCKIMECMHVCVCM